MNIAIEILENRLLELRMEINQLVSDVDRLLTTLDMTFANAGESIKAYQFLQQTVKHLSATARTMNKDQHNALTESRAAKD